MVLDSSSCSKGNDHYFITDSMNSRAVSITEAVLRCKFPAYICSTDISRKLYSSFVQDPCDYNCNDVVG